MPHDAGAGLRLLRYADSAFPAGGFAFSNGLETLLDDAPLSGRAALRAAIEDQLVRRWAPCERVIAVQAARAESLERLLDLDADYEALTLPQTLRRGSRRQGNALLATLARLGLPLRDDYRTAVLEGTTPGHLPMVQGVGWRACGMSPEEIEVASAHQALSGMLGASVRLGRLGALEAQRLRAAIEPLLVELLASPVAEEQMAQAFCPAAEIAAMRHETRHLRLFAN